MKFETVIHKNEKNNKGNVITTRMTDYTDIFGEIGKDSSLECITNSGILNVTRIFGNLRCIDLGFSILGRDTTFKASTRCVESDTYDEKIGRDIVEDKAALKYHTAMIHDYNVIIKELEKCIRIMKENKIPKHQRKIEKIANSINKVMPNGWHKDYGLTDLSDMMDLYR